MKKRCFRRSVQILALAGGLLLSPLALQAQALNAPVEFYFDEDRAAWRELDSQRGEGDALVSRLLRTIERDPRAWGAMARLGDIAMSSERLEAGRNLYARAIAGAGDRHGLSRSIRWHYGWALYRSGDAEGALEQWTVLANSSIHGQWMPPTLALVLWKLDRKEAAIQWYAAAVRTEPGQWASPENLPALLPQWRAEEHATLLEVQRAWAANPPAWP